MSWIVSILLSAVMLGLYDFSKKHAVDRNAVMPVLFLATLCGSLGYVCWALGMRGTSALVCSSRDFWLILLKSAIVSGSWICVYAAMQIMPISLGGPIRSTAPLWTLLAAMLVYGELPTLPQACGMAIILAGYFMFALLGNKEGFSWHGRGMLLILSGTLLGTVSALLDKYLINTLHIDPQLFQLYFSIDLVVIFGLVILMYRGKTPFVWRWSIPLTGILLILADYFYFHAVSCPDIQISILSLLRRSNVILSFTLGCVFFHDKNVSRKAIGLFWILLGTIILTLF